MANTQYGVQNGDKVRVSFEGTVSCLNKFSQIADVQGKRGDLDFHAEQIPLSAMTVTKPAPPDEPAVGTIIEYTTGNKWVRIPEGWAYISPRKNAAFEAYVQWKDFNHNLVRVMVPGEYVAKR